MEKRYQVFVSSTYTDLKNERDHVFRTLMEMDCIPAGMELFPAIDNDQFEFIKRVIDDCDYYLLIIGNRYGSLSTEGMSYTEKEFDYAVSKGLKVVALIHGSPDDLPVAKSDIDPELREKLCAFRDKVKTGRLVKFWQNADEIPGLVSLNMNSTIRRYPAIGWVRATQAPSQEILLEINELRKERDRLSGEVQSLTSQIGIADQLNITDIAPITSSYVVNLSYRSTERGITRTYKTDVAVTWHEIFTMISPYLIEQPNDKTIENKLEIAIFAKSARTGYLPSIDEQQFKTIGLQLSAYGLVEIKRLQTTANTMALFWNATEKGNRLMMEARVIRS